MTDIPTLTGQDIGQAEKATRAVLDRHLAQTGTSFHCWVALNLLGTTGPALPESELAGRMSYGLKISDAAARAAIGELTAQGLAARTAGAAPRVELTPAGSARFRQIQDGLARITRHIYGDLPAADLATAHRVLAAVTGRANAVLAAG
ncbi:MAG: MarR family winged helix-turn-helix transcriptional regulator [Gemmatimonadota bacterium]